MTFKKISIVKFLLLAFAMLMMTSSISLAQLTVNLPNVSGLTGNSVIAEVTVDNLTGGINSGQARLYVDDPAVAKITEVIPAGLTEGLTFETNVVDDSEIRVAWANAVEISGSNVLFNIKVEYVGIGTTPISTTDPNTSQERLRLFADSGELALTVVAGSANVPNISIIIPDDLSDYAGTEVKVPVNASLIEESEGISAYEFTITFDPSVITFSGTDLVNTLSANGTAQENIDNVGGTMTVAWSTGGTLSGVSAPPLLYLVGTLGNTGSSDLDFTAFEFQKMLGGTIDPATFDGNITISSLFNISGDVYYSNDTQDALENATVTLDADTELTDANGHYMFGDLLPGTYSISAAPANAWGGNSSADALVTSLYVSDPVANPLDEMQMMAADVNGGGITNADALTILNRVVGKISEYSIADWQVKAADDVVITDDNAVVDFPAICAGDVNQSYGVSAPKTFLNVVSDEAVEINSDDEFVLPIKVNSNLEIGAYTLKLRYDASKFEFVSLDSKVRSFSNVADGVVAVAWADLSGGKSTLNVNSEDALVTLKFKSIDKVDEAYFELLSGSEIVDALGKNLNATISVPSITALPEAFDLKQNYPNPFNPSTTVAYSIPVAGKVNLAIYNTLGQKVASVIDAFQEAGSYDVQFDASNLTSGAYFYRISVVGEKEYSMTKKMLLMK